MNLDFDQSRWDRIRARYRAWWDGTTDQPLVHLTLSGRDPGRAEPVIPQHRFASFYDDSVSADAVADRMVYDLECRHYMADAFPVINPNFGPGSIAAFLGLELRNGNDTVWFHQNEPVKKLSDIHFEFDPENPWFRRVCDIYRAMAGRSEKLIHLGLTDIGGNLDIIASFRQSQELLLDLYDDPEEVERKGWEVHRVWWRYFEEFNRIIQDVHPGYTAWTPLYSETPYYMLQCDFSFMIGNDMFERFCLPEIKATCSRLSNPFFHLDGPGMLAHLDSLLAVPELKGIQWVPGAGQKEITEWPEVYRKIRAAGKRFQFFASQSSLGWRALEILTEQLGSTEGIMMYGEAPAADGPEINTMLKRLGMDRN